jgi:hypothetical protein
VRFQFQKLVQIPKEKQVAIKLAKVFQQTAHQSQALLEGLVERRQVSQGGEATHRPPDRPSQDAPRDHEFQAARAELRQHLLPGQIQVFPPQASAQDLIRGLKKAHPGRTA